MSPDLDAWLERFERRAAEPPALPPAPTPAADHLPAEERARIARSVATFQLGEQSEGRTLLELARRHAARHGRPALVRITECFIAEEQRHAATLLAYMRDHGIAPLQRNWTDRIFRGLRRLIGFELAITVLITAELIGIQYYRALMNATHSKRLRAICCDFLQDEALHVAYESELLLALRAQRAGPLRALTALAHGLFHALTALVVWCEHRAVLRAAGHGPGGFVRTCARHYALYFLPRRGARIGRPHPALELRSR